MKGELPVVIAISGKARSGKDQTAEFGKEYLESLGKNVLIAHYADFLKFALREYKAGTERKMRPEEVFYKSMVPKFFVVIIEWLGARL